MKEVINQRVDFVYIFDVKDGNPNGDPDAGNLPRIDPENAMGLVTDVCLKRKIRNYVQLTKEEVEGFDIFIKENAILNNVLKEVHASLPENTKKGNSKETKKNDDKEKVAQEQMCKRFYDVRTFGAVMSTGEKGKGAGKVKGPVQLTFARSVDPIILTEHTITRMAVTKDGEDKQQEIGRKSTVPYGLYVAYGFISPSFAGRSGFSKEDETLLFEALKNMFDLDRSAARGLMSARKLIVFRHKSEFGDAPANLLFDAVKIEKLSTESARDFSDYDISIDMSQIPDSVKVENLI